MQRKASPEIRPVLLELTLDEASQRALAVGS